MQANPDALGAAPYSDASALPYLFKVLSVAKALSIQVRCAQRRQVLHGARFARAAPSPPSPPRAGAPQPRARGTAARAPAGPLQGRQSQAGCVPVRIEPAAFVWCMVHAADAPTSGRSIVRCQRPAASVSHIGQPNVAPRFINSRLTPHTRSTTSLACAARPPSAACRDGVRADAVRGDVLLPPDRGDRGCVAVAAAGQKSASLSSRDITSATSIG